VRDYDQILPFGRYAGQSIRDIPNDYLFCLCSWGKGIYYKSSHSLDVTWKIPIEWWELARVEADRRGYKLLGERWIEK